MAIKITINGNEVKNPVARLVFALLGGLLSFIVFALALFLLLPVMWFAAVSVLGLVIVLLAAMPRVINKVRIIQQQKDQLP